MSLRAFAVLAAVAAGGAALLFGPVAVLDAARWLRRRLGYEVPAPWLRPSPARWVREPRAAQQRHGRHPSLRGWHGDGTGCISYEEEAEWAVLRARLEAEQDEWRRQP